MAQRIPCPMCHEEIEADAEICPHCRENFVGVWREGKTLVMRKDAKLPERCVKSNLPAETHLVRNVAWHPSWVYILILLGLLFYVIVAVIVQKRAKIIIGLTDAWAKKRRTTILVAWLLVLGGLGIIIGGFATLSGDAPVITLIVGLVMMLGGAIYGSMGARLISVTRMTDEYVWLNGVCPEFLDELPDWVE